MNPLMTRYTISDLQDILQATCYHLKMVGRPKQQYVNVPAAFDIESTSFRANGEKRAIMYIWMLGINDQVVYGRTWEEFLEACQVLVEFFKLDTEHRLVIYIHNLAFEFQFIQHLFEWDKVFSLDEHKPVYARTLDGIEFRCSYILSGFALAKLGEQLTKYPCRKMVGDLDYSLLRHSKTPMTEKELGYCENDVRVVMCYIREQMESCGNITKIPMTKTGFVRQLCRDACLYGGSGKRDNQQYQKYHALMQKLTLEPDEYRQLKRAFQGGFTHANAWRSGRTYENVESYDFTSSYPAQMLAQQYPMSKGVLVQIHSKEEFHRNLRLYCCLFDVKIYGLEDTTEIDHPLSASRCWNVTNKVEDNGRLVSADTLCTTWTEQDFYIMRDFYRWDRIEISNFRRYQKGYLPTPFVKTILKLYEDKTTLKGVAGKETEYLVSKGMLNSCYGMAVTDICRELVTFDEVEGWGAEAPDIETAIHKYNVSKKRFLSYPWGIWVTAYSRRALFTGIKACGTDYIYADTDSVKVLHQERHAAYFKWYNQAIQKKLHQAMQWHHLPDTAYAQRTIEGELKVIGVWDDEGMYTRFKTLGAKRYITERYNKKGELEISITVSGVNKTAAVPYLLEKYGDRVFEEFKDGLQIPPEYTGKNTHTYINYPVCGTLTDYTGITAEYAERSSVHLEACGYDMSLYALYLDYLMGLRTRWN